MQKSTQKNTADAGMASGSWTISTETKNGVVTGFAVMAEEPKRAVSGMASERRTGGVSGARRQHADAQPMKAKR